MSEENRKLTNNIWLSEVQCKCGCGNAQVHPGFLEELQEVCYSMQRAGYKDMFFNSICRCEAHNNSEAVKGHPRSLHKCDKPAYPEKGQKGCMAVDIPCRDGIYRGKLFAVLWARGWSIGWNKTYKFLHADRRIDIGMPQTTFDY